jgi:hypothetical protein
MEVTYSVCIFCVFALKQAKYLRVPRDVLLFKMEAKVRWLQSRGPMHKDLHLMESHYKSLDYGKSVMASACHGRFIK